MPKARGTSCKVRLITAPARVISRPLDGQSPALSSVRGTSRVLGPVARLEEREKARQRVQLFLAGLDRKGIQILRDIQELGTSRSKKGSVTTETVERVPRGLPEHRFSGRVYRRHGSWKDRKNTLSKAWDGLIERLTDAYHTWKNTPSSAPTAEAAAPNDPNSLYEYTVLTYDIDTLQQSLTIYRLPDSTNPAVDLAREGFLAKTPTAPTVAIAFRTLELLHELQSREPPVSIEAFVKDVSDYYDVPYKRLRVIFADTYEVFLRIIPRVDQ